MELLPLVERLGLPLALLVVAVWWLNNERKRLIGECDARLERSEAECEREKEALRGERDRYEALAFEAWGRAEHALDVAGAPRPSPVRRRAPADGRDGR